jgi:hypothetical protein
MNFEDIDQKVFDIVDSQNWYCVGMIRMSTVDATIYRLNCKSCTATFATSEWVLLDTNFKLSRYTTCWCKQDECKVSPWYH